MRSLTGTGALLRLALRRDRIMMPAWVYGIAVLVLSTAYGFKKLFPTPAERLQFAGGIATKATFKALYGPAFNLTTTGGLTAWRITGTAATFAGLMSLLLAVRHTRAEEEAGRAELLGATVVGRYAGLAAALLVVLIANLALAAVVALGLAALGAPLAGAVAMALGLASAGCVFGAVAAVSAQVATTARGAGGVAGALLGLAFALRAAGDSGDGRLSWLSPIGWAQQARPFAGERWAVFALPLLLGAVLLPVAVALGARRDLGAGMLPQRAGRPAASRWLRSPWGLAWRLQRGPLLGWAAGFAAAGVIFGSVAKDVANLGDQIAKVLQRIGGGISTTTLVDSYIAAIMALLALAASGYVIQAVLRIRTEEAALRGEEVLATAVSRWRWAGAHLVCAALGSVVIMAAFGAVAGLTYGLRAGDVSGQVPRVLGAALVQVPAAWVLGGVAFAFVGVLPRLVALAWAAFGLCFGLEWIGSALKLPHTVLDLSPFHHAPQYPLTGVTTTPLLLLLAAAAALTILGLAGLRRRDML
jgi:ABC-2 type transport system permease protein